MKEINIFSLLLHVKVPYRKEVSIYNATSMLDRRPGKYHLKFVCYRSMALVVMNLSAKAEDIIDTGLIPG